MKTAWQLVRGVLFKVHDFQPCQSDISVSKPARPVGPFDLPNKHVRKTSPILICPRVRRERERYELASELLCRSFFQARVVCFLAKVASGDRGRPSVRMNNVDPISTRVYGFEFDVAHLSHHHYPGRRRLEREVSELFLDSLG